MSYAVKPIGSLDFLYLMDNSRPPRHRHIRLDVGESWGQGRYAKVACKEVQALNVQRCTECPLDHCTRLSDLAILEDSKKAGKC
jgi:hypothetical protein